MDLSIGLSINSSPPGTAGIWTAQPWQTECHVVLPLFGELRTTDQKVGSSNLFGRATYKLPLNRRFTSFSSYKPVAMDLYPRSKSCWPNAGSRSTQLLQALADTWEPGQCSPRPVVAVLRVSTTIVWRRYWLSETGSRCRSITVNGQGERPPQPGTRALPEWRPCLPTLDQPSSAPASRSGSARGQFESDRRAACAAGLLRRCGGRQPSS